MIRDGVWLPAHEFGGRRLRRLGFVEHALVAAGDALACARTVGEGALRLLACAESAEIGAPRPIDAASEAMSFVARGTRAELELRIDPYAAARIAAHVFAETESHAQPTMLERAVVARFAVALGPAFGGWCGEDVMVEPGRSGALEVAIDVGCSSLGCMLTLGFPASPPATQRVLEGRALDACEVEATVLISLEPIAARTLVTLCPGDILCGWAPGGALPATLNVQGRSIARGEAGVHAGRTAMRINDFVGAM